MASSQASSRARPDVPGHLFLVVSLGHSGTQWLTRLLHAPEQGSVCFSELKSRIWETVAGAGKSPLHEHSDRWSVNRVEIDHPDLIGTMHQRYFRFMSETRLMFGACGDVNSWTPSVAPFACRMLPVDTVLLLYRNGISVVNSLYTTLRELPPDHYVFTGYGGDAARLMGRQAPPAHGRFEQVCLQWLQNFWFPDHFARVLGKGELPELELVRFEDLVAAGDTQRLRRLCERIAGPGRFPDGQLADMQTRIVNRHQRTSDPAAIWRDWSPGQRHAFGVICGDAMRSLGYDLPS